MTPAARAAWRAVGATMRRAADCAEVVAEALRNYAVAPTPANRETWLDARRRYDDAEHAVAVAEIRAQRLAPDEDPDWDLWRTTCRAVREALAASPPDAAGASEAARTASEAAQHPQRTGPRAGPNLSRSLLRAVDAAVAAADQAAARVGWPDPGGAEARPDPRAAVLAELESAVSACEIARAAVTRALVEMRRASAKPDPPDSNPPGASAAT